MLQTTKKRRKKDNSALLKTTVPEFQSSALLCQNDRDIFFSPNGDRTGTAFLNSADNSPEKCLHARAHMRQKIATELDLSELEDERMR